MKITKLLIGICLLLFISCKAEKEYYVSTSFHEPADEGLRFIYSEDGIHWDSIAGTWLKPEIGSQHIMRDPSMVRTPDGTFHLVWTIAWKGDRGFGYANSKDLIHWSEQKIIPVMEKEPTTINVWAPEIFYDDEKQEFVVVWASCVPGRFEKGVEDENNNHRLYYITTKDFSAISDTKLLYDPGFSCIDAILIKRDKEDFVMVLKDNTRPNRNLKIAFAKSPTGLYSSPSEAFTEEFVEGPTVDKVGDDYFIYFDVYKKKIFGAMCTKDFISFTDETQKVSIPQGHKHGTIFKASASIVENLIKNQKK